MNIPTRLNLGSGTLVREGWYNVDLVQCPGVDKSVDLNADDWDLPQKYFTEVYISHVIEHLNNFNHFVVRLHGICKPGAHVHVIAPFFLSMKFYDNPDHRMPFGIGAFDWYEYVENRRLRFYEKWKAKKNPPVQFIVESRRFNFSTFTALKWVNFFINIEPVIFQRFLATILTPEEVKYDLVVV